MRCTRTTLAVAVLTLVATACGSTLSDKQIAAAIRRRAAAGETSGGGSTATTLDGLLPGESGTSGGGTSGGSTAGGGTSGGGGSATATTVATRLTATDVGVTASTISIGNVSTVGGPVPGLFKGGQEGIKAFVTYVNSQGGINGRKLRLVNADDGLDANRNRSNTAALASQVFAFVGSTSGVDYSGGEVLKQTGVPDVGLGLSPERSDLPNHFSPNPLRTDGVGIGSFNYFKEKFPGAEKKAAIFWHTQAISKNNGQRFRDAAEQVGYDFVYEAETQATEPNYTSHVLQMRQLGVRFIYTVMEVNSISRLTKAMEQQGFQIDVPNYGPQVYSQVYLRVAGTSANGTLIYTPHALFEDRDRLPEMALFLDWMKRAAPNTEPDIFALSAWASGRLFEQAARAAGPNLTRASLLAELGKIDSFDSNGLIAEVGPASKRGPICFVIAAVRNGGWVRVDPPSGYICDRGGFLKLN